MPPSRRLIGCVFALALLRAVVAPLARAADKDEFPVPQSNRFT